MGGRIGPEDPLTLLNEDELLEVVAVNAAALLDGMTKGAAADIAERKGEELLLAREKPTIN